MLHTPFPSPKGWIDKYPDGKCVAMGKLTNSSMNLSFFSNGIQA